MPKPLGMHTWVQDGFGSAICCHCEQKRAMDFHNRWIFEPSSDYGPFKTPPCPSDRSDPAKALKIATAAANRGMKASISKTKRLQQEVYRLEKLVDYLEKEVKKS
jgi:hypothetical protein